MRRLVLTAVVLAACGDPKPDVTPADVKDGALQRVELKRLAVEPPTATKPKGLPDVHIGEKTQGTQYELAGGREGVDAAIDPAVARGITLKTGEVLVVRKGKLDAPEVVAFDSIATKVGTAGAARADDIVGWYDTGHAYNQEKMGTRPAANAITAPIDIDQKGTALKNPLAGLEQNQKLGGTPVDGAAQKGTAAP